MRQPETPSWILALALCLGVARAEAREGGQNEANNPLTPNVTLQFALN